MISIMILAFLRSYHDHTGGFSKNVHRPLKFWKFINYEKKFNVHSKFGQNFFSLFKPLIDDSVTIGEFSTKKFNWWNLIYWKFPKFFDWFFSDDFWIWFFLWIYWNKSFEIGLENYFEKKKIFFHEKSLIRIMRQSSSLNIKLVYANIKNRFLLTQ